jgi:hypothetical protein
VKIQASRESLAGLLASAMMTGYFLRQMEQRMELETSLIGCGGLDDVDADDPGELRLYSGGTTPARTRARSSPARNAQEP